jgi:hypothetical protein
VQEPLAFCADSGRSGTKAKATAPPGAFLRAWVAAYPSGGPWALGWRASGVDGKPQGVVVTVGARALHLETGHIRLLKCDRKGREKPTIVMRDIILGDDLNVRKALRGSRQIILRRHFDRLSRSRHESIKSMVTIKRQAMKTEARRLRSWLRQRGILRRLVTFRFIVGRGWVAFSPCRPGRGPAAISGVRRPRSHL